MKKPERRPEAEKMELDHQPVPGYRTAFYITLAAAVAYLVYIFVSTT